LLLRNSLRTISTEFILDENIGAAKMMSSVLFIVQRWALMNKTVFFADDMRAVSVTTIRYDIRLLKRRAHKIKLQVKNN